MKPSRSWAAGLSCSLLLGACRAAAATETAPAVSSALAFVTAAPPSQQPQSTATAPATSAPAASPPAAYPPAAYPAGAPYPPPARPPQGYPSGFVPWPMPPAASDPRLPFVQLRTSRRNARLQTLQDGRWTDVCFAPCNLSLSPSVAYRVGGGASMDSEPFELPDRQGVVYVDARGGSKLGYYAGLGAGFGGLGFAALGGLMILEASQLAPTRDRYGDTADDDVKTIKSMGAVMIGAGLIVGLVGFLMWRRNKTTVAVH